MLQYRRLYTQIPTKHTLYTVFLFVRDKNTKKKKEISKRWKPMYHTSDGGFFSKRTRRQHRVRNAGGGVGGWPKRQTTTTTTTDDDDEAWTRKGCNLGNAQKKKS